MKRLAVVPMLLVSIACAGARRTPAPAPAPFDASPAGFERWVAALGAMDPEARRREVDARLDATVTTPLVDRERAVLFWRGEANRVQWIGDASQWDEDKAPDLARVEGTDLWWLAAPLAYEARLDYKFLRNGEEWILDPRCLRQVVGGYGPNSELRMPGYVPPPELGPQPSGLFVWEGYVADLEIESAVLGEKRPYAMYVPGGYKSPAGMRTLWFLDGKDYLDFADAWRTLDVLIARGDIPPVVAVFVPPVRRMEEYDVGGDAFLKFFTEELVPYVRERYGLNRAPELNVVIGPSMGALGAARLALARPDLFGNVVGQSGAYHRGDDAVIRDVREGPKRDVSFHLAVGTYDRLLEPQRRFAAALKERGYDVTTHEAPDGHSWGFWRAELGRALTRLLGRNPDEPYDAGSPR
ncbi:MAG TPA: alpha/beta hydrolase-fold protein [Candidatus Polarisedimenticolaceae bacterium]